MTGCFAPLVGSSVTDRAGRSLYEWRGWGVTVRRVRCAGTVAWRAGYRRRVGGVVCWLPDLQRSRLDAVWYARANVVLGQDRLAESSRVLRAPIVSSVSSGYGQTGLVAVA